MTTVRANRAARLAPMLLPVLSGCGTVVSVGPALYSTSEEIATAVKDAIREREGNPERRGDE